MAQTSANTPGLHRYAVVVAGGAGTRLWPLSRESLPKQIHSLVGDRSLIAETVERLKGFLPTSNIYISTTINYSDQIQEHVPEIPAENIIIEPVARGTAAAFALFSHVLCTRDPDAVIFSLASDHKVTDVERFHHTLQQCYEFVEAHREHIALVGIKPTRPDTSLGYIKVRRGLVPGELAARPVEKFVEKPGPAAAAGHVTSGDYYWNAAYYCFTARALLDAYDTADPRLHEAASRYVASGVADDYLQAPEKVHEIELIDSASHPMVVIPADFNWSDIGNWEALHRALDVEHVDGLTADSRQHIDVDGTNVIVRAKGSRIVVTVGVHDVSVNSTDDGVSVRLGDVSVVVAGDAVLVLDNSQQDKLGEAFQILHDRDMSGYL